MRPDGSKVEVSLDRSFQVSTVESQGRDDDESNLPGLSAEHRDKAGNAALARSASAR